MIWGILFWSKSIRIQFEKKKSMRKNIELAARGVPTWRPNLCPNSSRTHAKTGSEKDDETYGKSYFSGW